MTIHNRSAEARHVADAIKRALDNPARHPVRLGIVKDVDPKLQLVKVEIEPDGVLTDFIRYVGLGVPLGNWKAVQMPAMDTEVLLLATDPDCYNYVAVAGLYNLVDTPPTDYTNGTILLEHTNGNQLLLDTDGTIYLGGKSGASGVARQSDLQAVVNYLNNTIVPALSAVVGTVPPASNATASSVAKAT